MHLREIGWEMLDWIFLIRDRDRWGTVVNRVMNHRVLQNVGNILKIWVMICSAIKTLFAGVIYLARFNKGKIQTFGQLTEWEILKCGRQSSCSSSMTFQMKMAQKREWRITTPQRLSICSGYVMNNGCYETQFQMEDTTTCSKLLLRHFPRVPERIHYVYGLSVKVNKSGNLLYTVRTFKVILKAFA
jgi:hypothetical protein